MKRFNTPTAFSANTTFITDFIFTVRDSFYIVYIFPNHMYPSTWHGIGCYPLLDRSVS